MWVLKFPALLGVVLPAHHCHAGNKIARMARDAILLSLDLLLHNCLWLQFSMHKSRGEYLVVQYYPHLLVTVLLFLGFCVETMPVLPWQCSHRCFVAV